MTLAVIFTLTGNNRTFVFALFGFFWKLRAEVETLKSETKRTQERKKEKRKSMSY